VKIRRLNQNLAKERQALEQTTRMIKIAEADQQAQAVKKRKELQRQKMARLSDLSLSEVNLEYMRYEHKCEQKEAEAEIAHAGDEIKNINKQLQEADKLCINPPRDESEDEYEVGRRRRETLRCLSKKPRKRLDGLLGRPHFTGMHGESQGLDTETKMTYSVSVWSKCYLCDIILISRAHSGLVIRRVLCSMDSQKLRW
jgi:hypothetical protein